MLGRWRGVLVFRFSLLFVVLAGSLRGIPTHICVVWLTNGTCFGGDDTLTTTDVILSYSFSGSKLHIKKNLSQVAYALESCRNCTQEAEYTFNQQEHGGGECNCVDIYLGDVCNSSSHQKIHLCRQSASIPRIRKLTWTNTSGFNFEVHTVEHKQIPLQVNCSSSINASLYVISVSFTLMFNNGSGCNTINTINEGVEFSIRLSSSLDWIPLSYAYFKNGSSSNRDGNISLGNVTYEGIRGYPLPKTRVIYGKTIARQNLLLCGLNGTEYFQFRWLQTSQFNPSPPFKDTWILDDIRIDLLSGNGQHLSLINESFSNSICDAMRWPLNDVRNGRISNHCSFGKDYDLVFGFENETSDVSIVTSRSLLTPSYNLSQLISCLENDSTAVMDGSCYPPQSLDNEEDSVTTSEYDLFSTETSSLSSSEHVAMATTPIYDVETTVLLEDLSTSSKAPDIAYTKQQEQTLEATPTSHFTLSQTTREEELLSTSLTASSFMTASPYKGTLQISTSPLYPHKPPPSTKALTSNSNLMKTSSMFSMSPTENIVTSTYSINISPSAAVATKSSFASLPPMPATEYSSSTEHSMKTSLIWVSPTNTFNSSQNTLKPSPTPSMEEIDSTSADQLYAVFDITVRMISSNLVAMRILNTSDVDEGFALLSNVTRMGTEDNLVLTYLFEQLVSSVTKNTTISNATLKSILDIGSRILESTPESVAISSIIATTLFLTFDTALFKFFPESGTFVRINITLNAIVVDLKTDDSTEFLAIDTSSIPGLGGPRISLSIPRELLLPFVDDNDRGLRIVSSLFTNVKNVYSNDELGSSIVGSSLQCGNERCSTSQEVLNSSNVTITFDHSTDLKNKIAANKSDISCVFIEINRTIGTFGSGNWSTRGCHMNNNKSSVSRTVCECNHLTHFAILLSPKPQELSKPVVISLQIIGYIGVSVSLVAMGITIITFIMLRPLRGMRNYIHINLCISLAIAQIIFIGGVDKAGDSDNPIPIHCQVIAVLLHYFFLVSFMWMLMEGVVLYVALIRVFVKHQKRYMVAFTLTSYLVPLVYMGALTLPLGFATSNSSHYGYNVACFLNPYTHFIWAFISPVVLIFLANTGFLIMAAVVMWRHQMRQTEKSRVKNMCSWLRSALSLTVIMGLTWILGILIVEVQELVVIAYIYTIMVAFQGFLIFLVFVVFSKSVREAYTKWWKNKVNESDFLSKYFGNQSKLSSSMKSSKNFLNSSKGYSSKSNGDIQTNGNLKSTKVPIKRDASNEKFPLVVSTSEDVVVIKNDMLSLSSFDDCPEYSANISEPVGEDEVESSMSIQVYS